jgi:riboflavin kinase/FMN adenylyltransferase
MSTGQKIASQTKPAECCSERLDDARGDSFRPLHFEGVVLHGAKLGRTIGFPTANIRIEGLRPAIGIHAALVHLQDGRERGAVAYFGSRPTVGGTGELLEVFIFDFLDDIYGDHLSVDLVAFIRPDAVFDTMEEMASQIAIDRAAAARFLEKWSHD